MKKFQYLLIAAVSLLVAGAAGQTAPVIYSPAQASMSTCVYPTGVSATILDICGVIDSNGHVVDVGLAGPDGKFVSLRSMAGGGSGGVLSFNNRTGPVVSQSGDYTVSQVPGAAPLASPAFTGAPTGVTQAPGDKTILLATDAFVHSLIFGMPIVGSTVTVNESCPKGSGNVNSGWSAKTCQLQITSIAGGAQ